MRISSSETSPIFRATSQCPMLDQEAKKALAVKDENSELSYCKCAYKPAG